MATLAGGRAETDTIKKRVVLWLLRDRVFHVNDEGGIMGERATRRRERGAHEANNICKITFRS